MDFVTFIFNVRKMLSFIVEENTSSIHRWKNYFMLTEMDIFNKKSIKIGLFSITTVSVT